MKRISIIGSGWLGQALAKHLQNKFMVRTSTTTTAKANPALLFKLTPQGPQGQLELLDCDILIIVIPPFLGLNQSLIELQKNLSCQHVLFISSTSVFADDQGVVSETTQPQSSAARTHELIISEATLRQEKATVLRFGGLVGADRHPGRFLSGKRDLGGGDRPVNLIDRDDAVGLIGAVIEHGAWGEIFHGVCDEHRSRREFYQACARALNLPVPEFKSENHTPNAKIVDNQKVKQVLSYRFAHPTLDIYTRPK